MNLKEKREYLAKLHHRAKRKAQYWRREGHTAIEAPPLDKKKMAGYTNKQLDSAIQRFEAFNSRKNSFVMLGNGKFVTSEQWRRYKKSEKKRNAGVRRKLAKIESATSPNIDSNYGDWRRIVIPSVHPERVPKSSPDDLVKVNRMPHQITNENSLRRLTELNENVFTREHKEKRIASARASMEKMVGLVYPALVPKVQQLTGAQVEMLWLFNRNFSSNLRLAYIETQIILDPQTEATERANREDALWWEQEEIKQAVDWADGYTPGDLYKRRRKPLFNEPPSWYKPEYSDQERYNMRRAEARARSAAAGYVHKKPLIQATSDEDAKKRIRKAGAQRARERKRRTVKYQKELEKKHPDHDSED